MAPETSCLRPPRSKYGFGCLSIPEAKPSFEPCIPTTGTKVPTGADWFHEIKYDGYRLRLERDGDRVRLITRGGCDWAKRFPWIVEAARQIRQKHFVIDGEGVVLGVDGVTDFNTLHSRKHDHQVQLYAFDVLAMDGDDLRKLPLSLRKPTWRGCWRGAARAFLRRPLSRARSIPTCSGTLA